MRYLRIADIQDTSDLTGRAEAFDPGLVLAGGIDVSLDDRAISPAKTKRIDMLDRLAFRAFGRTEPGTHAHASIAAPCRHFFQNDNVGPAVMRGDGGSRTCAAESNDHDVGFEFVCAAGQLTHGYFMSSRQ